eukprot:TRINITY_DN2305_c0_g2_i1.p1 TRINITY_DN2305_c0_g2~~TRINITY_DN2305_c0_g2_i1.p1  ORF type:complete len:213 (+),score=60.89 TRINITY_DN2305_c0_g2_i1:66-704(+)
MEVEARPNWDANPLQSFSTGVRCAIELWDVLNMAIAGGWGDSVEFDAEEQRTQVVQMVVDLFTMNEGQVERNDIEDFLDEMLTQNYETEAHDGSVQAIANTFLVLYRDCVVRREYRVLTKLCERHAKAGKKLPQVVAATNDDSDDEGDAKHPAAFEGKQPLPEVSLPPADAPMDEPMEDEMSEELKAELKGEDGEPDWEVVPTKKKGKKKGR